jgi:hypothetical protein
MSQYNIISWKVLIPHVGEDRTQSCLKNGIQETNPNRSFNREKLIKENTVANEPCKF